MPIVQPPLFVGDSYYCESTDREYSNPGMLFLKDKLWDGEQCENEGTCCTTKSPPSPPWFSVELANPTTDDIEIRICVPAHPDYGDTPIELLEIYVEYNIWINILLLAKLWHYMSRSHNKDVMLGIL